MGSKMKSLPLHITPLPEYPTLQEQVKLPFVFSQFAFISQLSVPKKHSSTLILILI